MLVKWWGCKCKTYFDGLWSDIHQWQRCINEVGLCGYKRERSR